MATTNHRRTWGCKPHLIGENRDNIRCWGNDEPGVGCGQTNAKVWNTVVAWINLQCANSPLLSELLQIIPVNAHQNIWLWYDGAPEYFSIAMHNHLIATYKRGRLYAASEAVVWPQISPDLDPLDFSWVYLKSLVCDTSRCSGESQCTDRRRFNCNRLPTEFV
ncbi:hypothetical protein TNCV_302841 [Trichonephila clavipes]|nr:hypothetical protein TNCV_302841 [Trichonephila clavipes]